LGLDKRVVLGVAGSVAAYKAALLARELVRQGCTVRTILTEAAQHFVRPELFAALTGEPALAALFPEGTAAQGGGAEHVAWAAWAEVGVLAPATADLLARLAAGCADDLLTAWALAFPGPLVVAPAMHPAMWAHPAVQRNVQRLRGDGAQVLAPGYGPLAAGEGEGWGRLPEIGEIVAAVAAALQGRPRRWSPQQSADPAPLRGRGVVVTAGPTREPIDPVRFLSNPSSGRMGYAVAEAARDMGAAVTLVSGPVTLSPPAGVRLVQVTTALEMRDAVLAAVPTADLVVFAAAVSDWRPTAVSPTKWKRAAVSAPCLELVANPDISAEVAALGGARVLVGFAAEAGAGVEEAERKLRAKGLHLVAYNDVQEPGAGFGSETNRVVLVDREGGREEIGPAGKRAVAERILIRAAALLP
jgi:phosphopantothenoylcysteine decarboxylase/phosphopantothenate--cysteine ligase